MASEEEREKARRRRRNLEKTQKDRAERRGAFSLRPINPRKETYKRERFYVRDLIEEQDQE